MASLHATPPGPAARRRAAPPAALWAGYALFWLGVGLFQAFAEWEHYVRRGDPYPWEPFLWELSSAAVVGLLAVGVHRWNLRLLAGRGGWPARVAGHLAGLVAFVLAHSALMYALRFAVYGLAGVSYAPGGVAFVLGYEAPKDAVTYAILVGMSLGLHVFLREQRQAAELARVSEQLAQARLAQLQAQVHPHFLFNTLNLVSSVMHEDVERADRILAELADLLRLSMGAGRQAMHSVAHEMRWVEPFLSIMRQRFGERLLTAVEVDPQAAHCELPALLLMAPVENAVKHGVARASGATEVRVLARRAGDRLEIDVVDTGDAGPAPAGEGEGTGLANARARLATLYGDAASVRLERAGGVTRLRMTLPART
jgi:signal transduction histidine kinase